MPQEPAKRKDPRGGKRPGAGRPALNKVALRAYLPRDLVRQLGKLAKTKRVTKSKIIEEALKTYLQIPPQPKSSSQSQPKQQAPAPPAAHTGPDPEPPPDLIIYDEEPEL
jgi:hypothetical protein